MDGAQFDTPVPHSHTPLTGDSLHSQDQVGVWTHSPLKREFPLPPRRWHQGTHRTSFTSALLRTYFPWSDAWTEEKTPNYIHCYIPENRIKPASIWELSLVSDTGQHQMLWRNIPSINSINQQYWGDTLLENASWSSAATVWLISHLFPSAVSVCWWWWFWLVGFDLSFHSTSLLVQGPSIESKVSWDGKTNIGKKTNVILGKQIAECSVARAVALCFSPEVWFDLP